MTAEQTALFLGPFGLTLFLMYVVKRLWDAHERSDNDVVRQRDEALAIAREATDTVQVLVGEGARDRARARRKQGIPE